MCVHRCSVFCVRPATQAQHLLEFFHLLVRPGKNQNNLSSSKRFPLNPKEKIRAEIAGSWSHLWFPGLLGGDPSPFPPARPSA